MITKKQRANAERIVELSEALGHLPYNQAGQTTTSTLNLSIPCAVLVKAGVVTGVEDTFDGVNDQAVEDVERTIRAAVDFTTERHGRGWWNDEAQRLSV
jgi:hypothetical protein